jgi:serine/threonine protein kinase
LPGATRPLGTTAFDAGPNRLWRRDAPLERCATDRPSSFHWYFCSPESSAESHTHVAKVLIDQPNEKQWLQFEREAFIGVRLKSLAAFGLCDFCLTSAQPQLVYPRLHGVRLDVWLQRQPQHVSRGQWVAMALSLLTQLEAVHQLGYVHGHLRPEHVWVDAQGQIQLLGWGSCQPVSGHFAARHLSDRFDPPEIRGAEIEASSALDIFSAAAVIDMISAGQLAQSPVGKCMQAVDPYDRPTSGELVDLFASYQRELYGNFHNRRVA